jgi:hypothetical protein
MCAFSDKSSTKTIITIGIASNRVPSPNFQKKSSNSSIEDGRNAEQSLCEHKSFACQNYPNSLFDCFIWVPSSPYYESKIRCIPAARWNLSQVLTEENTNPTKIAQTTGN